MKIYKYQKRKRAKYTYPPLVMRVWFWWKSDFCRKSIFWYSNSFQSGIKL